MCSILNFLIFTVTHMGLLGTLPYRVSMFCFARLLINLALYISSDLIPSVQQRQYVVRFSCGYAGMIKYPNSLNRYMTILN